jgi:hypothetical protein
MSLTRNEGLTVLTWAERKLPQSASS